MNNEPISDDAMMHFIASCFAMNGMLSNAAWFADNRGRTIAPDAATLAKLSNEYADAMMQHQRNKNAKKKSKDHAMH